MAFLWSGIIVVLTFYYRVDFKTNRILMENEADTIRIVVRTWREHVCAAAPEARNWHRTLPPW